MHRPYVGPETGRVCIFGYGDENLDIIGSRSTLELRSCLDNYLLSADLFGPVVDPYKAEYAEKGDPHLQSVLDP